MVISHAEAVSTQTYLSKITDNRQKEGAKIINMAFAHAEEAIAA